MATNRQSGFTLIETVVALTMLAVILSLATVGLRTLGTSASLGARTIDRNDMLARGLDVVRTDMERIERLVRVTGEVAQFMFAGDATAIDAIVLEPPYPGDGGLFRLTYAVARDRGVTRLVRTRAPYRDDGATLARPSESDVVTVLEGAFDLRFSFLEREGERTRWVSRWPSGPRLPVLVRLEIIGSGNRNVLPPVIAGLRLDAEVGCISAKAGPCSARNGGTLPRVNTKEGGEESEEGTQPRPAAQGGGSEDGEDGGG